ncbi:RnfABCDGE type electron transport complex subunit D [Marinobacterium lutimaris]|uniref:Ion-translocating oxidoreductase complex subunit D n=1 Tax=Marinobacterium lutimaris TaxID=568106 RepID=A0A1H5YT25_9GAMM|nr:RnfABCDGE type electron transport complex subunit D [Marinobacterium lutimaris]SEG27154.1 electron transport complex protein RnfD [Marinobacterium lutimaris]
MNQLVSSPHAHNRSSVQHTMLLVCAALLPATLYGLYLFGWPAINLFVLCLATAIGSEAACLKLAGRSTQSCWDGSALLTGWLIAMTLPPWAPWWIAVVGTLFAVVIGKHLYGGLGQNLFNPAMLARVGLLISFPVEMTTWIDVTPITSAAAPGFIDSLAITAGITPIPDAVTGATALGHVKTALTMDVTVPDAMAESYSAGSAFFGNIRGSLGETSALLLLLGGLFLLYKRVISWHIPVSMLGTLMVLSLIFSLANPDRFEPPLFHLLTGAMMLGAFFIATDMVTSPTTSTGQLVFGAGIGAVAFIIRSWGSFPEAIGFAVLFMNAITPIIDRYFRPRIYGYTLTGKPINTGKE